MKEVILFMVSFEGNYMFYKKKSVYFFARGKREAVFLQGRKSLWRENKTSNDCRKIQNLMMSGGSRMWW